MEAPLQKILSRVSRAESAVKRKAEKRKLDTFKDEKFTQKQRAVGAGSMRRNIYKDEKHRRREDWQVGPRLLPRRDVGGQKEYYGTIPQHILYEPTRPERFRAKAWLAIGDRVAIMTGPDKGRIGRVREIDEEAETVQVKDLNLYEVPYPEWMAEEQEGETPKIVTFPRSLPWDKAKLVHAVRDEAGSYRDVVVSKIEMRKHYEEDEITGKLVRKDKRIIPGLEQSIPWPKKKADEQFEDSDSDTLRITVDESTFAPRLINPPMPPSIIDELRGKYSQLRTRHEPEYLARKEAEHLAKQQRLEGLTRLGMTPIQKAAAAFRAEKAPLPGLSEEQLRAIGEVVAREKGIVVPPETPPTDAPAP